MLGDGRVLVAGGHAQTRRNPDGSRWRLIGTAELYDAKAEKWSPTGSLTLPRQGIGALTLLANGKVLLAGEHDIRTGAELYDPSSGRWTATGSLVTGRGSHSSTLLLDGQVLIAGGTDYATPPSIFASAEIYEPATGTWTATGSMAGRRFKHVAVRLLNGKVLVAGGTASEPSDDKPFASSELYDPVSGTWKATGSLSQARETPAIALLPKGKVLIAGGAVGKFRAYRSLADAEIYDPETESWTKAAPMAQDRVGFTLTTLPDGRVLAAGGVMRPNELPLARAEIYDAASGTWSEAAPMANRRWNHRAVLLPSGQVLVVGGFNHTGELTSVETFTPP